MLFRGIRDHVVDQNRTALPGSPQLLQQTPEYRPLVRGHTPTTVTDYISNSCVLRMGRQDESNQMVATGLLMGVRRDSATLVQLPGGEMGH